MVITLPSGAAVATAKKAAAKAAAAKKPRAKSNHPRTSDMVDAAIAALKEKGGSSLQAIKKYIAATYKVDAEKLSPFIKKYLKSSVSTKKLVQTKGTGAAGSFKLGGVGEAAAKKRTASPKRKKSPAKKPAGAKPKKSPKKKASPKKKVPKALAAKPPKPKVSKPKPAKKVSTKAKKPALKAKKAKK